MDDRQRSHLIGGHQGRIILLGDGTEVLTDSAEHDSDMFDQSDEEEKDLESQVRKGQAAADGARKQREETPGPSSTSESSTQQKAEAEQKQGTGPGSTPEEPKMKPASDGPAPSA